MLARDPTNPYDPNAIKVLDTWGDQIGFLPRGLASRLSAELDGGLVYQATLHSHVGGDVGQKASAKILILCQDPDQPDQPIQQSLFATPPENPELEPAEVEEDIDEQVAADYCAILAMRDAPWADRKEATLELREAGAQARPALGSLIRMACNSRDSLQAEAIITLGYIKLNPQTLLPLFIDLLETGEIEVKRAVGEAIRNYGPIAWPTIPALIHALYDGDASVKMNAALGLSGVAPYGEKAIEALELCLQDLDITVRFNACLALGAMGPMADDALPSLARATRDPISRVSAAAASAIIHIRDPERRGRRILFLVQSFVHLLSEVSHDWKDREAIQTHEEEHDGHYQLLKLRWEKQGPPTPEEIREVIRSMVQLYKLTFEVAHKNSDLFEKPEGLNLIRESFAKLPKAIASLSRDSLFEGVESACKE